MMLQEKKKTDIIGHNSRILIKMDNSNFMLINERGVSSFGQSSTAWTGDLGPGLDQMCSIFKDKDQDLKLVLLFWFLPLMVGGYQGKVSLIRASLKYLHIWTKLVEAAKFSILRV